MLTRIVKSILTPSPLEEGDLDDLNYIARCPKESLGSNPGRVAAVKKALVKAKQSQTVMEDDFV